MLALAGRLLAFALRPISGFLPEAWITNTGVQLVTDTGAEIVLDSHT